MIPDDDLDNESDNGYIIEVFPDVEVDSTEIKQQIGLRDGITIDNLRRFVRIFIKACNLENIKQVRVTLEILKKMSDVSEDTKDISLDDNILEFMFKGEEINGLPLEDINVIHVG